MALITPDILALAKSLEGCDSSQKERVLRLQGHQSIGGDGFAAADFLKVRSGFLGFKMLQQPDFEKLKIQGKVHANLLLTKQCSVPVGHHPEIAQHRIESRVFPQNNFVRTHSKPTKFKRVYGSQSTCKTRFQKGNRITINFIVDSLCSRGYYNY